MSQQLRLKFASCNSKRKKGDWSIKLFILSNLFTIEMTKQSSGHIYFASESMKNVSIGLKIKNPLIWYMALANYSKKCEF